MVLPRILSLIFLVFLFFLFSFSLGEDRLALYSNLGYMVGSSAFGLSLLYILKINRLQVNHKIWNLFFMIQIFTIVFGLLNEKLLESFVNPGHQLIFFGIFITVINFYKLDFEGATIFLMKFIIITSTISLIYAVIGFLLGNFSVGPFIFEVVPKNMARLYGWYDSPNYLGPVIAIGAMCLLFFIVNRQKFSLAFVYKVVFIVLFVFHVIGLVLTGSKGSYLAFILGLPFLFIGRIKFGLSLFINIVFAAVFLIATYYIVASVLLSMGVDNAYFLEELIRMDSVEHNMEGGDRIGYHITALEMLSDANVFNLFFGFGIGHFIETMGHSSHSGIIEVVIGRGLILFIMMYWMIVLLIKKAYSVKTKNIGGLYIAIIISIIVKNFTNVEFPSNNFSGIILVFIIAIFSLTLSYENKKLN